MGSESHEEALVRELAAGSGYEVRATLGDRGQCSWRFDMWPPFIPTLAL